MRISCIPAGIVDPLRTGQGLIDLKKAGFDSAVLDLAIYTPEMRIDVAGNDKRTILSREPEKTAEVLTPFLKKCNEISLSISVVYAPFIGRDRTTDDLNEIARKLAIESVRLAIDNGFPYVVVRPLSAGISHDDIRSANVGFYSELDEIAGDSDVKILLENQGRSVGGHLIRGFCSDPDEASSLIGELNSIAGRDRFGFCFNVATCSLCGQNPYEVLIRLKGYVDAVVISDNDGIHDTTFLPFSTHCRGDQTDWLGVIRGLREIGFDGELMIAMEESAHGISPMIRPKLLELAVETAGFICWQIQIEQTVRKYDKRVLFGAGNMCLNYMKNYGEEYPPLYTCDNNPSRWGETFAGLEIRNPEDLKSLPSDTAIFICNVYYREIEEQLKTMGLSNPIERFNDEYLPVLNMNRIDRKQEGM